MFKRLGKCFAAAVLSLILFIASLGLYLHLNTLAVFSLQTAAPATTSYMELRVKESENFGSPLKIEWKWVPLSEISPYLVYSIIETEDPHFFSHHGVDWKRTLKCARILLETNSIISGGSTITQQVARNLYLTPERSFIRKLKEFWIAQALERDLSKDRILEIYLNIAEWGNGIFGAEAASLNWFGCHASELSPRQAVDLAFVVPSPRKRDPTNPTLTLHQYGNIVLLKLVSNGILSFEDFLKSQNVSSPPFSKAEHSHLVDQAVNHNKQTSLGSHHCLKDQAMEIQHHKRQTSLNCTSSN